MSAHNLIGEACVIPEFELATSSRKKRPSFDDVSPTRRANMKAIKGTNTRPEVLVRRLLHKQGYRFRLHGRGLPGTPDIVFPGRRKIIEVRGCFWHRHPDPGCRNAVLPRSRSEWWKTKLELNVARDVQNLCLLENLGWSVLVVWECELAASDLSDRLRVFLDR